MFQENEIGIVELSLLTEDDPREMGLPIGPRSRFLTLAKSDAASGDKENPMPTSPTSGEAERRQLPIMFCDLVGSTEMSQKLDPRSVQGRRCTCLFWLSANP